MKTMEFISHSKRTIINIIIKKIKTTTIMFMIIITNKNGFVINVNVN